ncbi:hypothetical protein RhiirA5_424612 [Rhizophagus irregularis]|uniref:BAH domain-containing protein n=1 Tax=Rhizophagus irregularis TaxID=588596 RepID=A0A2N0P7R5_9GLOM|nr:hypothetical protein RhiirA5_424612 [Rhizophagus irregularis]
MEKSNILNNPLLYDKFYFGPGIEAEEKKEYWHGDLWAESPLFGQEKITINREIYYPNEFIIYKENGKRRFGRIRSIVSINDELQIKIQRICTYYELPNNLHSNVHSITSESQLWLIDQHLEEGSIIANTYEIIKKVDITIVRDSTIITNSLFIKEILYKNNGHWKLRDATLDYMHPCEYSALSSPPSSYNNFRILKIFIDIYYDDFGTYRNTYHSLGGVYIQLGNMPFEMRKHLRNHFVLGFVPFGGCFKDFIHPFIKDMKQLEKGILMNIQGRDCWIIAGLECITADLPQGNDLTGCRTCLAKENATDITLDIASISRYHHITNIQFKNIFTALTLEERNNIAKEYGLQTSLPIFDQLQWERHLQSPQDIYHIIAGKTLKLLKLTITMLSPEGERNFIREWKSFEYPKQWSKLPNPISHLESFMMSDRIRLGMVMPFILNRSLTINCLKQQEMDKLQRRIKLNRNQVINAIIKCWAIVAKCSQLTFKISLTIDDRIELERYLKKEREALVELFDDFVGLPNLHASYHLSRHVRTFGTLVNTAVGTKEMVYRKNIEFDLLKYYTTLQAIRHLSDGGIDPRNLQHSVEFMNLFQDFSHLFKDWFIMESSETDNKEFKVCSPSSYFRNIMLRKPVSVRNTNIGIDTVSFRTDLALAYESFGYNSSLINKTCNFYEYASYIQDVHNAEVQCHLSIDDVVTIQVADYGESYAVIKGIFKHKSNDGYLYPFIYVDWFEDICKNHNRLECPIFVLRHDDTYCKIFPLTVIEKVQKVHFVHDCNSRCKDNHNLENKHYLRNDFFFKVI